MVFYDNSELMKHYYNNHYFCEVCKRKGIKLQEENRKINLPEFEVYRDLEAFRKHCRRHHLVCFEDGQDC